MTRLQIWFKPLTSIRRHIQAREVWGWRWIGHAAHVCIRELHTRAAIARRTADLHAARTQHVGALANGLGPAIWAVVHARRHRTRARHQARQAYPADVWLKPPSRVVLLVVL